MCICKNINFWVRRRDPVRLQGKNVDYSMLLNNSSTFLKSGLSSNGDIFTDFLSASFSIKSYYCVGNYKHSVASQQKKKKKK